MSKQQMPQRNISSVWRIATWQKPQAPEECVDNYTARNTVSASGTPRTQHCVPCARGLTRRTEFLYRHDLVSGTLQLDRDKGKAGV